MTKPTKSWAVIDVDGEEFLSATEQMTKRTFPRWSYFLEAPDGTVLGEKKNVPISEAPRGAEYDDDGNILGHWHPFEP